MAMDLTEPNKFCSSIFDIDEEYTNENITSKKQEIITLQSSI